MMELTDSSEQVRESTAKLETRFPLGIDLNEIPSSSLQETLPPVLEANADAFAVVRNFHDNLTPADGAPAGVPGEGKGSVCAACGLPEVKSHMVVCDGCERGFHLSCVGMLGRQGVSLDEWICGDCVTNGGKSKRWPLGRSSSSSSSASKRSGVMLLDINALPPSDGEGEESENLLDSSFRKHIPGDNSLGGNPFGARVTYPHMYAGNGFGFQKESGVLTQSVKLGFEGFLHSTRPMDRSFEEVNFGFQSGKLRSSNDTANRLPSRNPNEILLQSLREFISEKQGVLEEGWSVEFQRFTNSCELFAVYCAPDGKRFETMSEVASYLGLMPSCNSMESKLRGEGPASLQQKSHLPKRRKTTRLSYANGFAENKETWSSGFRKELFFDAKSLEICPSKYQNNEKVTDYGPEENERSGSQQSNGGFPVQYEDFFILSLGKLDVRPSYHDVSCIWPVGYRSCWHDKITGSIFVCYVSDGGDSGPLFRVKRYSCSASPIPIGSTVLLRSNLCTSNDQNKKSSMDRDEHERIQMFLSEPCPPKGSDIISCLGSNSNVRDVHAPTNVQFGASSVHESSGGCYGLRDEIGEFSEEGRSSSLVWRLVCQKLINAVCEVYKRTGTLKLICKHFEDRVVSPWCDIMDGRSQVGCTSLDKFCSSSGYVNIASVHFGNEPGNLSGVLEKWLGQDRFGLDTEFVQEYIEQFPDLHACSQYEPLNKRNNCSTLPTLGNGILLVERKCGVEDREGETSDGLFKGCKRARTQMVEEFVMDNHCPPSGKPFGSRLPPELVGDVLQVWEYFGRFYDILGLKEPLSFEELEEELISPWLDCPNVLDNLESENQNNQDIASHGSGSTNGHILSSSSECDPSVSKETLHTFIQMETGAMKEAAQAKLASITYSRCTGVALTKAHNSLLKVLVIELQSKVAVLVDPNFDARELKSRRGKKKDAESSVSAKRTKLNMLPINELTWPELARRYILAVLTMDGNIDSAEITTRESGKVFRCLQGDGGVLCGSLTGVAGMEADALLLAEATKKIFSSLNRESDALTIEDEGSDAVDTCQRVTVNDGNIPEWAELLEPVRKLPTNVGTRIRKCVYEALAKGPPEWAKKILEHSISKEVYKGNASGPTKKAVLSVLANARGEGVQQKPVKERKRTIVSVSDIIMKQCRIVLRRAAAADEEKVFCNLLGRKLMNSNDNDDEGLLGSPAMVSRPLDFRTIDMRLAVGAYGGSHEAFLEDVRELWINVRMAFGEQPDFVELAETLSQNFESLYEMEVVPLVQKLVEYAKSGCLSAEMKKELDNILVSTSAIPKAPWDEGVCKVCGVDKDDDSVLLCDTCDAEYHTYCLSPPLARIPKGNWYCPSCAAGKCTLQDSTECTQVTCQRRGKKYHGEYSRHHLEALTNFSAVMEEKEYWEFNVDERIFLLKFLCDELLNSALIRQHLEQCVEMTAELQQKLRATSMEWKSLTKFREEMFVSRAAKVDTGLLHAPGEVGTVEGLATALPNHGKNLEQQHTLSLFSGDLPQQEGGQEGTAQNVFDKYSHLDCSEKNTVKPIGTKVDNVVGTKDDHLFSHTVSQKNNYFSGQNDLPLSDSLHGNMKGHMAKDVSTLPPPDSEGLCISPGTKSTHVAELVPPINMNGPQSVKNDIALLQDSIVNIESQLQKQIVRREFLGCDSAGRLYWASAKPGRNLSIIVDGSVALQHQGRLTDHKNLVGRSSVPENFATANVLYQGGSKASCPFIYGQNDAIPMGSPWVSYSSEAEIRDLVGWLNINDPKERELKESILNWLKLRSQDFHRTRNQGHSELQMALSKSSNSDKILSSNPLVTKAAAFLEKKHGPCFDLETSNNLRRHAKKSKVSNEGKMYRCECLEPIWPSRHHCLTCHRTFLTDVELEEHNDGKCSAALLASEKSKENFDTLKAKGCLRLETIKEECISEASKSGCFDPSSRIIKFQNQGLVCPYDFEEICSKFRTNDSSKELVQQIGLLGSKGIPSFVPSISPYLADSTLELVSQKGIGVPSDEPKAVENEATGITTNPGHGVSPAIETSELSGRSVAGYMEQKDKNPSLKRRAAEMDTGHCCVVPQASLRPLVGKASQILKRLKMNLLDMDAALPEDAMRPSKAHLEKRWAWRFFVKSAQTIFEMVQATIVFEDMIKTGDLKNGWWYWSSLTAAAKISTLSSLALRIYTLDSSIIYEKTISIDLDPETPKSLPGSDPTEKSKGSRKSKRRREVDV